MQTILRAALPLRSESLLKLPMPRTFLIDTDTASDDAVALIHEAVHGVAAGATD